MKPSLIVILCFFCLPIFAKNLDQIGGVSEDREVPSEISKGEFGFVDKVDYLQTRVQENILRSTPAGEARYQELARKGQECAPRTQGLWVCIHFHKKAPLLENLKKVVQAHEATSLKFESPRGSAQLISEAELLKTWKIQQRVFWNEILFEDYEWIQNKAGESTWLRRGAVFKSFIFENGDLLKVRESVTTTKGSVLTTDYFDVVLERL